MTSSSVVYAFDASNYQGFREAIEKELEGNKNSFWNDSIEGVVLVPMMIIGMAYILLTTDIPFLYAVLAFASMGLFAFVLVVFAVSSHREPQTPPIRITTGGMLTLGKRRCDLMSVAEIELSGRILVFRNRSGKKLLEARDYQSGDLESFVSFVKRQAPDVVVRADRVSMAPKLVRIPKM